MRQANREPIREAPIPPHHPPATATPPPAAATVQIRPASVDALVTQVAREFPQANIRATGGARNVVRQAQLMAHSRRTNRHAFLHLYIPQPHITEMDQWVLNNPNATEAATAAAYVEIINRALQRGATVSNHLTNRARDIAIPTGDPAARRQIRQRINDLGGHVIDERDAANGPHWHVDYVNP